MNVRRNRLLVGVLITVSVVIGVRVGMCTRSAVAQEAKATTKYDRHKEAAQRAFATASAATKGQVAPRGYYKCTKCSCIKFFVGFPCNSVTCCRSTCGHGFSDHNNNQFLAALLDPFETESAGEAAARATPEEAKDKKSVEAMTLTRGTDFYRAHCFEDSYIGTWGNIWWGLEQAKAHDTEKHGGTETCMVDHKVE